MRAWQRSRGARERLLYGVSAKTLSWWQRRGVTVVPNHYYQPVPDLNRLPESLWSTESSLSGIDMRVQAQIALVKGFAREYRAEYETFPREPHGELRRFHLHNGTFEAVDAEILYCMIRRMRPQRVVEVGAGNSTLLTAQALQCNADLAGGSAARLTVIEPFPSDALRAALGPNARLIARPVQEVPMDVFDELESNDVLFIDSSHVLKIGSDVSFELLEVVPRLRPGVLVHFHDVFWPAEYPRGWVREQLWFWNEQYALQAFLAFNEAFEVVWAGNFMHLRHADALRDAFGTYDGQAVRPGSLWIRRSAE
jgi:predicted O-methyltransferase YrrM